MCTCVYARWPISVCVSTFTHAEQGVTRGIRAGDTVGASVRVCHDGVRLRQRRTREGKAIAFSSDATLSADIRLTLLFATITYELSNVVGFAYFVFRLHSNIVHFHRRDFFLKMLKRLFLIEDLQR